MTVKRPASLLLCSVYYGIGQAVKTSSGPAPKFGVLFFENPPVEAF